MSSDTVEKGSKACMWSIRLAGTGIAVLIVALLGARMGLSPMIAMLGITLAVLCFVIGAIAAITGLIRSGGGAGGRSVPLTWVSALLGVAALVNTGMTMSGAGGAPIHDISTDLDNPPAFVAVADLRTEGENPAEYTGGDTADLQRAAYPDLATIVLLEPQSFVYQQALGLVKDMDWEIVAENSETGVIEATATTPFVGFKDDVVIRIRTENAETLVDIRSKSRIGRGDMGVNADRVRAFRDKLLAAVNT